MIKQSIHKEMRKEFRIHMMKMGIQSLQIRI